MDFAQYIYSRIADFGASVSHELYKTFIVDDRYTLFIEGFRNTLLIAFFASLIGIAIGSVVAIVRVMALKNPRLRFPNSICGLYVTIIRGTPVTVQLLIMYYIILSPLVHPAFRGINPLLVGVLTFGINSGAYVAEIVRAGIMSVDPGQSEAGRSLGLSEGATMRLIILPQAVKNILPALGNEFIVLLKETSIAGYIAIRDLTRAADIVRSRTLSPMGPLLIVAAIYLIVVIGMTKLLRIFERRLAESDNR